jgi:hypothetical protein
VLSNEKRELRLNLFKDLKISQFNWFIKLNFENWPVIHISFKVNRTDATFPLYRIANKNLFIRILMISLKI